MGAEGFSHLHPQLVLSVLATRHAFPAEPAEVRAVLHLHLCLTHASLEVVNHRGAHWCTNVFCQKLELRPSCATLVRATLQCIQKHNKKQDTYPWILNRMVHTGVFEILDLSEIV